jgi:hypothetical protein
VNCHEFRSLDKHQACLPAGKKHQTCLSVTSTKKQAPKFKQGPNNKF